MSDDAQLWMVLRTDANGLSRIICEGVGQAEAETCRRAIVTRHSSPHRQDYDLVPYTPATRSACLKPFTILL